MTPGMQIRFWLREAAGVQIASAAVVGVAVLTLVLASVASTPSKGGSNQAVSAGSAGSGGAGAVGGAGTAGGDVGSGTGAGPAGSAAGAPAGSAGGGSGGGLAASAGGTGGAGGAAGAGAVGTGVAPNGAKLTASDVGVTATQVKIGFNVANVGGLGASGFALGLRSDMPQIVQAYVDYVNAHGGINGRRVQPVVRKTDPLSQDDQHNACTYFKDDQKVFGVVDTATHIYADTQRCYGQQNHIPFSHSYALSTDFQNSGQGYEVTVPRTLDRIAHDWAIEAKSLGVIKGGEKVGIFTDKCEPSSTVLHNVLAPALKADGASDVIFGATDCNPEAQQTQSPNVVTQFKTKGVQVVFPATSYVGVQVFLSNADSQLYKPRYFASDYDGLTLDLFAQHFSTSQWDGVLGVNGGYSGWQHAGKPQPARQKFCSDLVTAKGLPPIDNSGKNSEAIGMCDQFFLMVQAATLTGNNLTRAGWASAVTRVGAFPAAGDPNSTFGPGKFNGDNVVQTVVWHKDCTCYTSISDFRSSA